VQVIKAKAKKVTPIHCGWCGNSTCRSRARTSSVLPRSTRQVRVFAGASNKADQARRLAQSVQRCRAKEIAEAKYVQPCFIEAMQVSAVRELPDNRLLDL